MKALTLWQPYAALVALGEKQVETRSWPTRYRGPLLIHAAKWRPRNWRPFSGEHFAAVLEPIIGLNEFGCPDLDGLAYGRALAVVQLVDVAKVLPWGEIEGYGFPSPREEAFGNYSNAVSQRYAWILEGVEALPEDRRVEVRGRQGLWNPPAEIFA